MVQTNLENEPINNLPSNPFKSEANDLKLYQISRDFRSDTQTAPTDDMLIACLNATRGDDVFDEDESTKLFENKIAQLTGKEAALFCVSGTMTNQLALRTHLKQPPHSVLLDARSHIYRFEAGGVAFHSQAHAHPISPNHHITLEDVKSNVVLEENIHFAPTRVICLENATHGLIIPQDEIIKISEYAKSNGLIMHLDGARLWNVHAETGLPIHELCDPFDSVSLCMSKGLGAPIGSVLVGSEAFIKKAKWFRKLFGGGIRQSGFIASAAHYALENNLPKIKQTHLFAKHIESEFKRLGVKILSPVESSMVFFDPSPIGISLQDLKETLEQKENIKISARPRLVIHYQISQDAVEKLISVIESISKQNLTSLSK